MVVESSGRPNKKQKIIGGEWRGEETLLGQLSVTPNFGAWQLHSRPHRNNLPLCAVSGAALLLQCLSSLPRSWAKFTSSITTRDILLFTSPRTAAHRLLSESLGWWVVAATHALQYAVNSVGPSQIYWWCRSTVVVVWCWRVMRSSNLYILNLNWWFGLFGWLSVRKCNSQQVHGGFKEECRCSEMWLLHCIEIWTLNSC